MHVNLDAAELDLLVEALHTMLLEYGPDAAAEALRAKLAGTCR